MSFLQNLCFLHNSRFLKGLSICIVLQNACSIKLHHCVMQVCPADPVSINVLRSSQDFFFINYYFLFYLLNLIKEGRLCTHVHTDQTHLYRESDLCLYLLSFCQIVLLSGTGENSICSLFHQFSKHGISFSTISSDSYHIFHLQCSKCTKT